MKIFSETTISFVEKTEQFLKEIIQSETSFKLKRSRFEHLKYTYPIHIVVFTNSQNLGYFDPHTYQIGLHETLMYQAKDHVLKNILRHELAHYICFIEHKNLDTPHGENFKNICSRHNWEQSVSKASMDIKIANNFEGNLKSEKIINKIKALLKLAESDNEHEAESATLKANQLLLKHNISSLDTSQFQLFTDTVLVYKRRNAKLCSIYEILKHFLVKPVFTYGQNQVSLEVSGSKENIKLAHYISQFLERELEVLWKQADHLKGQKAKNSFFHGIARGYDDKIYNVKKDFTESESKALIILGNQLEESVSKIYRRLSSSKSGNSIDGQAFSSGKISGNNLTINAAIKNKTKTLFLNWSK